MFIIAFTILSIIHCNVIQLNSSEQFYIAKKNYSPLIVYFYGYDRISNKFLQEFQSIANGKHVSLLNTAFPLDLNFVTLDIIEETTLIQEFNISNLPAIFFIHNTPIQFQGAISASAIISWIKKTYRNLPSLNQHHPSQLIQRYSQLEAKFRNLDLFAILFTSNQTLLEKYVSTSKKAPSRYSFFHSQDLETYEKLKIEGNALKIHSKLEDREVNVEIWEQELIDFTGDLESEVEMLRFLEKYSIKGLHLMNEKNFEQLSNDSLPTIMGMYNRSEMDISKIVDESRYDLLNKSNLGLVEVSMGISQNLSRLFSVDLSKDLPVYLLMKTEGNDLVKYKGKYRNPIELYQAYVHGEIEVFYRSEGNKMENKNGLLWLGRDNYYDYLEESNRIGRDVLMFYRSEDCQECNEIEEILVELCRLYGDDELLVFGIIDGELNELKDISSWPRVRLFKSGMKNGIECSELNREGIMKLIRKQSNYGKLLLDQPEL